MVRPDVVRRKLTQLHRYLDELEAFRDVSLDAYQAPDGPRRAVERLLQLIVEVAVDTNVHIVTEMEGAPPPDYRSSFSAAARHGVFPAELGERLAPSAGLRNILVHEYGDVRDEDVHSAIHPALDDFREFAHLVREWLERSHPPEE